MEPVTIFQVDDTTRVVVEYDEFAEKPDWGNEGDFPIFAIEYLGWYKGRPLNAAAEFYEDAINGALSVWGRDYEMIERYVKAFHGATELSWAHPDQSTTIFCFDPQEAVEARMVDQDMRHAAISADLYVWSAWASGEVYTLTLETLKTGLKVYDQAGNPSEPFEEWEAVETVGGYYGDDEITDEALTEWAKEVAWAY